MFSIASSKNQLEETCHRAQEELEHLKRNLWEENSKKIEALVIYYLCEAVTKTKS